MQDRIATKLEALRLLRGLSQRELGRESAVSHARICQFEGGRATPPSHGVELLRLALALGLQSKQAGSLLDPWDGEL